MNAFTKDIVRTIRHTKKRFISIAAITALGATMLTGLSMPRFARGGGRPVRPPESL